MQPGFGKGPIPFGRGQRDAEGVGYLRHRQARKETELDQVGLGWLHSRQFRQGLIEGEDVQRGRLLDGTSGIEIHSLPLAPPLESPPAAGLLNDDPPHCFRRGSEEMAATVPLLCLLHIHQPKVGIVDQGRRLERLPWLFLRELRRGQLSQFVINQRQQLLCRRRIARFDLRQDAGDVGHGTRLVNPKSVRPDYSRASSGYTTNMPSDLTHFDDSGASRMVDVGEKAVTSRLARASGKVIMERETLRRIKDRGFAKGDVLEVARLAGIMAAKKTGDLIPLCHPLPLDAVTLSFSFPDDKTVALEAEVRVTAKTGVEMEALAAVSVAALTIYDMCKAIDRGMVISEIRLEEKSGGRSGHFVREA
jgi:cyclic pyranopterin phosphate synthase